MALIQKAAKTTGAKVTRIGNALFGVIKTTDTGAVVEFKTGDLAGQKGFIKVQFPQGSEKPGAFDYRGAPTTKVGTKEMPVREMKPKELITALLKGCQAFERELAERRDIVYAPLTVGATAETVEGHGDLPVYFVTNSFRLAARANHVIKSGDNCPPDTVIESLVYMSKRADGGQITVVEKSGQLETPEQLTTILDDITTRKSFGGRVMFKVDGRDTRLADGDPDTIAVSAGGYAGADVPAETTADIQAQLDEAFFSKGFTLADVHFVQEGPSFAMDSEAFAKHIKAVEGDLKYRHFQSQIIGENSVALDSSSYGKTISTAKAFPAVISVENLPNAQTGEIQRSRFPRAIVATGATVSLASVLNHPKVNEYYASLVKQAPGAEQAAPAQAPAAAAPAPAATPAADKPADKPAGQEGTEEDFDWAAGGATPAP